MDNIGQLNCKTCTDRAMNVNRYGQSACGLETVVLRGKSKPAGNKKMNAIFLFGGFIVPLWRDLCVIKQLCFVSTVVRACPHPGSSGSRLLPSQIKNFVYPLCVVRHLKQSINLSKSRNEKKPYNYTNHRFILFYRKITSSRLFSPCDFWWKTKTTTSNYGHTALYCCPGCGH